MVALLAVIGLLAGFKAMSAQASTAKVGLITFGSIDDDGWNWLSYQGLLRAQSELGVVGTVYTTTSYTQTLFPVQLCAKDGNDLCIGVGFLFYDAISTTASISPTTKFAIIDSSYENPPPNLRGVLFASQEAAYLAGTLAALMSETDVIGAIGGMDIPPVTAFTDGYRNGAQCANIDVTTVISYAGNFSDPDLGAQLAQAQIALGADVVFGVGGTTGNGAIITATQSDVWGIGVDTDLYYTLFMSGTVPGSDHLLSSAVKKIDNAVFYTISDLVSGPFASGTVTYGLNTDGVGLAPFHEMEPFIPAGVRTQLDWIERAIIGGSIDPQDPNGPCLVIHQHYLPLAMR